MRKRTGARGRSGSLLVVTLWLVVILSVLAVAIARHLSLEVRLTKYRLARERAQALARSGVYVAMARLGQEQDPPALFDALSSEWAQPPQGDPADPTKWVLEPATSGAASAPSGNRIEVRITDEERKLNLNGLPGAGNVLFAAVGKLLNNSEELAARIVDYIDADEAPAVFGAAKGLEQDDSWIPPYRAKNGALAAFEEVVEIPGMAELSVPARAALAQFSSVYTPSDAKLNINTVSPEVLIALGFRESVARQIDLCRQQGKVFAKKDEVANDVDTQCLNPASLSLEGLEKTLCITGGIFDVGSHRFTVRSDGVVALSPGEAAAPSVRVHVEAVVERSTDPKTPPKILAWREG